MRLFLQFKHTIKLLLIILPFAVVAEKNNGSIVLLNELVDIKPAITPKVGIKPIGTAVITPEVVTAPTVTPVVTTPTVTPVVTTPAVTPVVTTPTVTPVVTTPTVTPVVTTPAVMPVVTTPAVTPVVTTPAVMPVVSTPTVSPDVTTPTVTPVVITPEYTYIPGITIPEKDLKPILFPVTIFDMDKIEYEPNNSFEDAKSIFVNFEGQTHKFDYAGDEDWLKFYAEKDRTYTINLNLESVGEGVNPAIELYNADNEVEAQLVDLNETGKGEILKWQAMTKGYYYIRVVNKETQFTIKSHYKISVIDTLFLFSVQGAVQGKVINQCTQKGVTAEIVTHGNQSISLNTGEYGLGLSPGTYTLTARATNLQAKSKSITMEEGGVIEENFELSPEAGCSTTSGGGTTTIPTEDETEQLKQAVATYDQSTGILTVKDVRVGDDILNVKLQRHPDSSFLLTTVDHLSQGVSRRPAFYNHDSLLADIPELFFVDRLFQVKLRRLNNEWRFVVEQQDLVSK
ncbi:MAG: hypothetical protein KAH20_06490 [Methylococcales bacterium]|nr:hypothetical protein [Methylococcales bacterium]